MWRQNRDERGKKILKTYFSQRNKKWQRRGLPNTSTVMQLLGNRNKDGHPIVVQLCLLRQANQFNAFTYLLAPVRCISACRPGELISTAEFFSTTPRYVNDTQASFIPKLSVCFLVLKIVCSSRAVVSPLPPYPVPHPYPPPSSPS